MQDIEKVQEIEKEISVVVEKEVSALERHSRWLYFVSALVTFAILLLIAGIWYRVYNGPYEGYPGETVITTPAQLDAFLQTPPYGADSGPTYFIPTGIAIQSAEFKGPYTVQLGGYVWQRFKKDLPPLNRGVVFPDADSTTFTKIYEAEQGDETLIGWNFKTTVREQFDYSKYPLERQRMWMRIWSVDFAQNVFLVPDLSGYERLEPTERPGLDAGLVLENWEIDRSFFSFRPGQYNSNFGIAGYTPDSSEPELYFNVGLKRYILSPLVARGIAPLLILIQLFVIVMVIGSDTKRLEQFGVKPGAVIFTCAAFFFAVLLAQNALRDEVKWYGVVYLETVHLLTYFVILGVAACSVALVAFPNFFVFRHDNLWLEVLYWPLIVLILLLITLATFGLGPPLGS